MNEGESALHAVVRGRVQRVGFRFFVERQARALGLKGWVRNGSDGITVEVLAEGPRAALESLVEDLKRGPRLAQVERVDATWIEPTGQFLSFALRA